MELQSFLCWSAMSCKRDLKLLFSSILEVYSVQYNEEMVNPFDSATYVLVISTSLLNLRCKNYTHKNLKISNPKKRLQFNHKLITNEIYHDI